MVVVQRGRAKKKPTGGRYKLARSKRKHEIGRRPTLTKLGKHKVHATRTKGGQKKMKLLDAQFANVYDPKNQKFSKSAIKNVEKSPANRHFVRRNIIVKGTIIETDAGKAKVTSRPGQSGTVNAVLI